MKFLYTFRDYYRQKCERDVRSCYTVINRENVMVYIINNSFFSTYLFGYKVISSTSLCVLTFGQVLRPMYQMYVHFECIKIFVLAGKKVLLHVV